MDIICAKCGRHFSSIESAREHYGQCKYSSTNEGLHWSTNKKITSSDKTDYYNSISTNNIDISKPKQSNLFNHVLASKAICPYCSAKLPKAPTKSHICNKCKNKFYIQVDLDGQYYAVTELAYIPTSNILNNPKFSNYSKSKLRKTSINISSIIYSFIAICVIAFLVFCVYMMIDAFNRQQDTISVAHEAFNIINEYRLENGLASLSWDNNMEQEAIQHSQYMDDTKHFVTSNHNYNELILEGSGASLNASAFPSGNSIFIEWKHYSSVILNSTLTNGAIGIAGNYASFFAR